MSVCYAVVEGEMWQIVLKEQSDPLPPCWSVHVINRSNIKILEDFS